MALGDYMNVQCHSCIGGTNLGEDIRKLDYGQHVVSGKWINKILKKTPQIFKDFWQLSPCSPDLTTNYEITNSKFSRIEKKLWNYQVNKKELYTCLRANT